MTTVPTFRAHNGFALPALGLGTYRLNGDAGAEAVAQALRAGYRLVDSAFNYENEGSVGRGVAASGVPRSEVIVTTKLPGRHHARATATASIEESRSRLGLDATDLHLIHWPNPSQDEYVEAWAALVDAQSRGVVRQIGVSNFLPEHLERIERETGVRPVVNQIEVHPYFPQEEQLAYHRSAASSPRPGARWGVRRPSSTRMSSARWPPLTTSRPRRPSSPGTWPGRRSRSRRRRPQSTRPRTSPPPRSCSTTRRSPRSPHSDARTGACSTAIPPCTRSPEPRRLRRSACRVRAGTPAFQPPRSRAAP